MVRKSASHTGALRQLTVRVVIMVHVVGAAMAGYISINGGRLVGEIADGMLVGGWFPHTRRRPKPSGEGKCPKCGGATRLREGTNGKFYGCRDFPECKGSRDYVAPKGDT